MDRHVRAIVSHRLPTAEELEAGCDEWLECCEAYIHRDNCMTTKPQSTTEETLEPCPFCDSKPETGITGAPECDNWRYVKCSNNYCSIRYSLFTVKSWNTRHSPASTAPVVDENVKRFSDTYEDGMWCMDERPNGRWVRYADHKRIVKSLEAHIADRDVLLGSSPATEPETLLSSQVALKIALHIKGKNADYFHTGKGLTELEVIISQHFAACALASSPTKGEQEPVCTRCKHSGEVMSGRCTKPVQRSNRSWKYCGCPCPQLVVTQSKDNNNARSS